MRSLYLRLVRFFLVASFLLAIAGLIQAKPVLAASFTNGNIVVYRVGSGSGSLVNTGNPVFLDEYTPGGTLVQSIALPTTVSGSNKQLIASGTATSEGMLARSADGQYLILTGYGRDLGQSGSISGTAASVVNRVVGRVDWNGNVDTSTALTDFANANNPRSAVSNDGTQFWVMGGAGGIRYASALGSTTSTQLTSLTNFRQAAIFGGQLYVSSSSSANGFIGVGTVGSGLPTTTGQAATRLTGLTDSNSPSSYAFFFADLDLGVAGVDTLYIADDSNDRINKFSLVGGTWTLNGQAGAAADDFRGITGVVSGTTVTLYATRKGGSGATGGGELVSLVDTGGYNANFSGTTFTLLTSAGSNTAFRGVALAPVQAAAPQPDLAVGVNGPTNATINVAYAYTLTVSNNGTANATGVKATFTLPGGVTFNSANGTNGFSCSESSGVVTCTGGSINASSSATITVNVTPTALGTVSVNAGAGVVDPDGTVSESNESNNATTQAVNTIVGSAPNTAPTIQANASTTDFLNAPASSPAYVSGVIGDSTDPAQTLGIDFDVNDAETAAASLTVTGASSNTSVVTDANIVVSGAGVTRNVKITPTGAGYTDLTITVSDGLMTGSYVIHYAASTGSSSYIYPTDMADGSTAIALDSNYMLVANDEDQKLRVFDRDESGLPLAFNDVTASLGLTDMSGGNPREVDLESSTRVGNRIYWLGSHSNSSGGSSRPNRYRVFATDVSGSGAATSLTYVGRYDGLRADLLSWDNSNAHGLGADYFGLTASAAIGVIPETPDGSGFNIEGLVMAPGSTTTAYLAFRAPIVPATSRTKALIVPVTNFDQLVTANPAAGPAAFGAPIQLDLGGRGIRSISKNAGDQYVIFAGPPDSATGVAPKDFRIYTWTGNAADAPELRTATFANGITPEGMVEVPDSLTASSILQYVSDEGDTIWYGDGTIAKELPNAEYKKFRVSTVALGTVTTPTAITVAQVNARVTKTGGVQITWQTLSEGQLAGFNVYRATKNGTWKQINPALLQAKRIGNPEAGARYRYLDKAKSNKIYRYKLEVLYLDGRTGWTDVIRIKTP